MNAELSAAGIEVDYLFSGRRPEDYFDMEEFGNWQSASGLSFIADHGRIALWKTARKNQLINLWRDIKNLDLSSYDRVICDFEPITAWAAKRQGVDCIALGHQYAFQYDIPIEGDSWLSRALIKHFAPGAQQLGLHWHHFDQPILPPIVHIPNGESTNAAPETFILVYLGFEDTNEVLALLEQFPDTRFVYYGAFSSAQTRDNIQLEPLSVEGFKLALHRCNGVICNAGFELASEAIQLGKPILVKPLKGQMEQLSNARALEQLKLGSRMETLCSNKLRLWLKAGKPTQYQYPNVAKAITEWLLSASQCSVAELSKSLWSDHHQTATSSAETKL